MRFFNLCASPVPINSGFKSHSALSPHHINTLPESILSEVFPVTAADAGAIGFVISRLQPGEAPILWVQDWVSGKESGRPYLPGLNMPGTLVRVNASRPIDVLWAMESGLQCKGLSAVIGEIWGDPPAVTFTATKRLATRAEANGIPCWLIRRAAVPNLSAARERWQVASLPSARHMDNPQAPGHPRWQVELFRSRFTKPGRWVAAYDRASRRLNFSAPLSDAAMAEENGAVARRAAG